MIYAHIAGIPVEETLLMLAPVGLLGVVAALRSALAVRMRRLRRRPRGERAPRPRASRPRAQRERGPATGP